jgi:hypothetical protein
MMLCLQAKAKETVECNHRKAALDILHNAIPFLLMCE